MKLFAKAGGSRNKENIVFGTVSTIMKFLTSKDSNLGKLGELANMVSYFWDIAFWQHSESVAGFIDWKL